MNLIAKYAKLAVVIAVLCGATSGSLSAMTAIPAMGIGFLRLTIALPFFLIPALASEEKRSQIKALSRRDLGLCVLSGVFLFGHFFSWFSAVKLTNVASAAVLASLHPLVVLLVTVFIMKKKVSWKSVLAILVALCGGAVIMGFDLNTLAGGHLAGNILGFLAGMFMGLYFSVGDAARKTVNGDIYVLLVFAACWVCFAGGVMASGTPILGYTFQDYLYVVLMAFICQIGSHAVFNMCIGHVSSLYVSTIESGDPVFSILVAVVCLGQIPALYEIVGCIIVVGALLYYNYQESREETI
ncbi:MAG: DMT family transporter [Anaerovoracaceae bacterium]